MLHALRALVLGAASLAMTCAAPAADIPPECLSAAERVVEVLSAVAAEQGKSVVGAQGESVEEAVERLARRMSEGDSDQCAILLLMSREELRALFAAEYGEALRD